MPVTQLNKTFAALADPTRRAILARLTEGEATLTELAVPFDMTIPAVAKHLRVLEDAGLVSRTSGARRRPCRIEPAPLAEAAGWLEGYRTMWEARFERLDALLDRMERDEPEDPSP